MTNETRNSLHENYMAVLEAIDATIDPIYHDALNVLYSENTHANGVVNAIANITDAHELHAYALSRLLDTHAKLAKNK